jgi:hypothetical protein
MKKNILLLTLLFCMILGAYAQNNNGSKFGVGITSGVAVGPVSDAYPTAGELVLKFESPIQSSPLSLTISTGLTYYVSKSGFGVGVYGGNSGSGTYSYGSVAVFVPVMAGAKIFVAKRVFIEGDAGVSFNINSNYLDFTGKKMAFIYAANAGYAFPIGDLGKNSLDVGLGYENRVEQGGGFSQFMQKLYLTLANKTSG